MSAEIIEHPKAFIWKDLSRQQRVSRPMAHCQFRQNRIFKDRFSPENEMAYKLMKALNPDRLHLWAWQIEEMKAFAEIEIIEDRRR